MNNNKPFDHEIETQRDKAFKKIIVLPVCRDRDYAKGVEAALDWVLGNIEYPPMEE